MSLVSCAIFTMFYFYIIIGFRPVIRATSCCLNAYCLNYCCLCILPFVVYKIGYEDNEIVHWANHWIVRNFPLLFYRSRSFVSLSRRSERTALSGWELIDTKKINTVCTSGLPLESKFDSRWAQPRKCLQHAILLAPEIVYKTNCSASY